MANPPEPASEAGPSYAECAAWLNTTVMAAVGRSMIDAPSGVQYDRAARTASMCVLALDCVRAMAALEKRARKDESVVVGWSRADADYDEFRNESIDYPAHFWAIAEDSDFTHPTSLAAAILAAGDDPK